MHDWFLITDIFFWIFYEVSGEIETIKYFKRIYRTLCTIYSCFNTIIILIRQTQLLTPHFFSTNEKDFQTIKDFQRYTFSANVSVTTSLLIQVYYFTISYYTSQTNRKENIFQWMKRMLVVRLAWSLPVEPQTNATLTMIQINLS